MTAAEIRERFLSYFEGRDHRRMPSASLVPPTYDPSVLLTTAGMQPFKPYFRGDEQPPHNRLTSCQKCFRTVDIEVVRTTAPHLTFLELHGDGSLTPLPKQNIDTGLGLDRFAAILQDVPSVFETAHFRPLVELGEELSGRGYSDDFATMRALRIIADHGRGMSFLLAD